MNWLIWKQHHKQFIVLVVISALYAALVIPTGLHFWHMYQHALTTCGKTDTCAQLNNELLQSRWDSNLNPSQPNGGNNLMVMAILALPALLGVFVGVPLIAREYNEGTNLLIWTRSFSRRKWLTTKLAWILATTALFVGVFAVLTTWLSKTGNSLYVDRFDVMKFDTQGIVPVTYAIFAVSIGIALGTWLKRITVAIGLTLALFLATQILVAGFVRPHYMTPWVRNVSINQNTTPDGRDLALSPQVPPNSGAAWVIGGGLVDKTDKPLNWSNPPQSCIVTNPGGGGVGGGGPHTAAVTATDKGPSRQADAIINRDGGPSVDFQCLNGLGYHWSTQYQPAYRYWDFQRIETGLYLTLSLLPIGATYWLVQRRDA